jgi:hypothetical protein
MDPMERMCARPGCTALAFATFNFDGLRRIVWLGPLSDAPAHGAGDLCRLHAERMTPPRNWELRDTRVGATEADDAGDVGVQATTPLLSRAFRGVPANLVAGH